MRISVSSWATTDEDVKRSAAAIINVARKLSPHMRDITSIDPDP